MNSLLKLQDFSTQIVAVKNYSESKQIMNFILSLTWNLFVRRPFENLLHSRRSLYFQDLNKEKTLLTALITCYFLHAPVVLMFQDRKLNSPINRIHERRLRILHNIFKVRLKNYFFEGNFFKIYHRNLVCRNKNLEQHFKKMMHLNSLDESKAKNKTQYREHCLCKLPKSYSFHVGFAQNLLISVIFL